MPTRPRLLLVALTLLAFGNAVRGSFHFDDYSLFTNADRLANVFRLETTRPLTWLIFHINRAAFGENPLPWHAIDLALHLGCVLLFYECARKIGGPTVGFFAAALFAIHPIQTEAVAYVFARSTLLMTGFCLLSWRAWLEEKHGPAAAFFACALLSKEECVFFPIFLLLWERGRQRWKPIGAMLLLSALAGVRVIAATRAVQGSGAGFSAGVSVADYASAQGLVIWRYFSQIVWPAGFTVDPDIQVPRWAGIAGWLALLAALFLLRTQKAGRYIAGTVVLLLASSSIFPATDLAADRRMYLPMISLCIALAMLLTRMPKWVPAACALLLVPISVSRTEVWRTELSLWSDAAAKAPDKVRPAIQLSRAVPAAEGLRILAVKEKSHPNDPNIPAEQGRIHLQSNHPELAVSAFGRAAALRPGNAQGWSNLGVAFQLLGQEFAARQNFQHALRIDPCLPDARKNLRRALCD